jgi:hypothetical protein
MEARRRAVVIASALTAALIPLGAAPADADPTGPAFGYLTTTGKTYIEHDASSDRLWATEPGDFATKTLLAPENYVYAYDVSEDGNTLVLAGQSRRLSLPAVNVTRGILLTVRDPVSSAVVTRSLSTYVDSNPDITPDGRLVFWIDGPVLYRYDVQTQITTAVTSRFAPLTGEYVERLAVSPDGTKAAVVFRTDYKGQRQASRLVAATLAPGGDVFEESDDPNGYVPFVRPDVLAWTPDSAELLFTRVDIWQGTGIRTYRTTLAGTPVAVPSLYEAFDLSVVADSWYRFRLPAYDGVEVGSSVSADTAPSDWTTFPTGPAAKRFLASAARPPVVTRPVNRAPSTARLYVGHADVYTGEAVVYASLATYLTDPAGVHPYATDAAQVRYGTLLASRDGKTFSKLATTGAGSSLLRWPTGEMFGNGRISAPQTQQNIWLRWCFGGDIFASGGCSSVKKITVHPRMSLSGSRDAAGRIKLLGSAKRTRGTVILWRWSGTAWRALSSTPITSSRTFTFAYRSMPAGIYRVTTKVDVSYGQGELVFRV